MGVIKKASLVRGVMPADLGLSSQSNTGYASASSRKLNTEGSYAEAKSKMQSKQWFEQFKKVKCHACVIASIMQIYFYLRDLAKVKTPGWGNQLPKALRGGITASQLKDQEVA